MRTFRILAILFLLSFVVTLFALQLESSEERQSMEKIRIEITPGQSVSEVAALLKRERLIRSSLLFRWYLRMKGADRSLHPGTFLLAEDATFADLLRSFVEGAGQEVTVTIPEGYTIAQIDALLSEMDLIGAGELLVCAGGLPREVGCDFSRFEFLPSPPSLEGYLFPDTYFVSVQGFAPQAFLERLLATFEQRVVTGLKTDLEISDRSLHEIMTMASLIERETRTAEERSIVSGILWKRFEAGTVLDVDATVRYALSKLTGPLTKEDLEMDSPYNTRRYRSLPPGPIANPGLASITAALHPEDSPYFYYLHDRDGQIHYSITNDEHNEKKMKYL